MENPKRLDKIISWLRQSGLKSTQQRIVIFDALFQSKKHPSSEDIYKEVRQGNPSISLGTVYNTLETFANVGLARKVPNPSGLMRYDAEISPHNHIHIKETDEIIDFHDEDLQEIIKKYLEEKEFDNLKINNFSLHIEGEKINPTEKIHIH